METDRLEQQLKFLVEADKMKTVLRQTLLADGSRRENDAEHSWHLALCAMVLFEYAYCDEVDLFRVLQMGLVHDMIEIYAGDTFCYDYEAMLGKEEREKASADKLFALLPYDQGVYYRSLWEEFDEMETPDAKYAASIDRLQPILNNFLTGGHTWKLSGATSEDVYKRMAMIKQGAPQLWSVVEYIVNESIKRGYLER